MPSSSLKLCAGKFLLAVLAGVLLLPGPSAAAEPERLNLLLITVDTLRADRLSSYGYHRLTTPHLDHLAAEGVRFDRAYTVIPLTGPAHVSLFTGRFPQEHGAKVNGQPLARDPRLLTLAQVLAKHGYETAAFISAWPLKERLAGLDRGFGLYEQAFNRHYQLFNSYRSAEDVTPRALRWLEAHSDKPFFLWVHYFDPHKPYELHPQFAGLPANPRGVSPAGAAEDESRRDRVLRYDSEVAYADHHIGKLLDGLEPLGLRDSTLVVVTADHGESLGEYGYVGHGKHLYENIVRIPLILRSPRTIPHGQVIRENVSLLDIMPTVLDLLGISLPLSLPGKTLRPFFEEPTLQQPSPAYFLTFAGKKWQAPKWLSWLWYSDDEDRLPLRLGYVVGDRKLVWTPRRKRLEVYDLARNNGHRQPLFSNSADETYAQELRDLLTWFESTIREYHEPSPLRKQDIEILESLGYTAN